MQFFETVIGKRFFEVQFPKLIKELGRIADALEKEQKPADEQIKEILIDIHEIGGTDAQDEYSKGFDNAITEALSKVEAITGISASDCLE